MKGGVPRRWLRGAVIGLGAGVVAFAATYLPLIETYEHRTFDLRTRFFADSHRADPGIVAVVVDQKSLDEIAAPGNGVEKGWPWPRDFHAGLVSYLAASGARAIVFDFVFSERSIYTQERILGDDVAFAEASSGSRVVQAIMLTREAATGAIGADRAWAPALRGSALARRLPLVPAARFDKATPPIPPLLDAAAGLGWIGFEPDVDGVARAIHPAVAYAPAGATDAIEIRALPLVAATVAGARVDLEGDGARRTLRVNGRAVALDEQGRMVLRFHGGEGVYRQFGYWAVLRSAMRAASREPLTEARPEDFRDKIVLVGATAAGLLDLRATPMGGVLPGYLLHATALDNLLHADPIRRATRPVRAALLLGLGIVCGAAAMVRAARVGPAVTIGIAVLYLGTATWAFGARGFWLDLVAPGLALALAWGGSTGYAYVTEGRERRFLHGAFSRYLAPDVVAALVSQPGRLALGGEKRELTIMFADVAGFTTLSEGRDPREVVTLMNECFTALTNVIQAEGGTVDKFIGDAVMAFWNAPVAQADHAARAMRAGRELLLAVARVNDAWASRDLPKLGMRVGIGTGPAVVGNVGSNTKFNYTVMGDTVNLSSRLEGAAKYYGATSMVTDAVVAAAGGSVPVRELDMISVKGRAEPVRVFELVQDNLTSEHAEALRAYAKGLEAYRAREFEEAAVQFDAALALVPDDGPSLEMRERCHELAKSPPPANWRGEHVLTSK